MSHEPWASDCRIKKKWTSSGQRAPACKVYGIRDLEFRGLGFGVPAFGSQSRASSFMVIVTVIVVNITGITG